MTDVVPLAFWTDAAGHWPSYGLAFALAFSAFVLAFLIAAILRRDLGSVPTVVGGAAAYAAICAGTGALPYPEEWRYGMFLLPVLAASVAWLLALWRPMSYLGFAGALALTVAPLAQRLEFPHATGAMRWQPDIVAVDA